MAFGDFARQDDYGVDPMTGVPFAPSGEAQGKFGRIADAVIGGLRSWVETPGRALRGETTPEEAYQWGPATAFGMIAGSKLPGGAAGSGMTKLPQQGIRAYHGSPHDFDKFDISKIGTGEGAQAYGHGLYFAENEGVARGYRDALSGVKPTFRPTSSKFDMRGWDEEAARLFPENSERQAAFKLFNQFKKPEEVLKEYDFITRTGPYPKERFTWEDAGGRSVEFSREKLAKLADEFYSPGHMYEVSLNARPEQFLDWDRPLAQMSPEVQDKLHSKWLAHRDDHSRMTGEGIYGTLEAQNWDSSKYRGAGKPVATKQLAEAGIPGIRYLDQGSRGSGTGTSNYVVWMPEIIEIMRKYGLAGAGATGFGTLAAQDNYRARP